MAKKPNLGGRPRTRPKGTASDIAIGKRVRAAREAASMTQADLGSKVNRHPAQIYRYENGSLEMGVSMLTKIAAALKVTVSELLVGKATK